MTLNIDINEGSIKNEPSTPPIFKTDLNIRIQEIPSNQSGEFPLPVVIRCNKKVNFKTGHFTVLNNGKVIIIKGELEDLFINELSDDEYFKKRFKWKYPIYFDLRFEINENN